MGFRLGVDLGTTFTAAAIGNGQPPAMLGLGNRALQIPSVLFLQDDGQFLVGEAAERRGMVDPSRVVREFKRRIGDPVPVLVAGTPFSPQALTARLLSWVVAAATERQGSAPDEVVLTYPANWGDYKRELLDQVVALADIGKARTCPEPQAAAIQYSAKAGLSPGARVAVYDLGGGTFDVCVLEKTADGFTILGSPDGVEHLGGVDFDEAVFQHVLSTLGPALADLDPNDTAVKLALTRLRRDCVEAKEALSADVETVIPVSLPGRNTSVRLTRAELESLIGPSLQDTIAATSRALRGANTTSGQLSAIVLVGGSSRIPLVSHLLQSTFATTTSLDTHPKHDIALGAVQYDAPAARRASRTAADATTTQLGAVGADETVTAEQPATDSEAETAQIPSGTPPAGPGGGRELPWKWIGLAAGGVGAVAAIVLGTMALVNGGDGSPGGGSSQVSTPARVSTPPSSPASVDPLAVPKAAELTTTQLIVPWDNGDGMALYLADADSGSRKALSSPGGDEETNPVISPDRRSILYMVPDPSGGPSTLWVAGSDLSGARPLWGSAPPQCAKAITRPGWNPNDTRTIAIACKQAQSSQWKLYIMRLDGTIVRTLATAKSIGDPGFSPDGRTVVIWGDKGDGPGIFVVAAAGSGGMQRLTSGSDADPAYAPAGGLIAFRRALSKDQAVIVVMDPDGQVGCKGTPVPVSSGSTGCQITAGAGFEQDPSWSPDAKRIAFKTQLSDAGIAIVQADGSSTKARPLWPDLLRGQNAPAWSSR